MELNPTALTTIKAVRQQLDIEGDDEDALLVSLIEAATAAVETFCKRRFAYVEDATETLAPRGDTLFLRRPPIEGVDEVRHDDKILSPDDYEVFADGGLLTLRAPSPIGKYTVKYSGGFITPGQATDDNGNGNGEGEPPERTLPRDIELACLLAVTTLYRNRGRDANVTTESVLSVRQSFGQGWFVLSPAAQALLHPWRLA